MVKDSAAAGLVAVAVLGAAGVAILLPRPAGIAVTIAAVAAGGLGWRVEFWSGALIWTGLTLLAVALAMSLGAAGAGPSPTRLGTSPHLP